MCVEGYKKLNKVNFYFRDITDIVRLRLYFTILVKDRYFFDKETVLLGKDRWSSRSAQTPLPQQRTQNHENENKQQPKIKNTARLANSCLPI